MARSWRNKNRKQRILTAKENQKARAARSDQEQIDLLVEKGHGHCKEVEKLRKRIEKSQCR